MDTRLSVALLVALALNATVVGQFEIEIDHARASNAAFTGLVSPVSPLAVAVDPTLANAVIFDLSVDANSDILLFEAELNVTAGSLYLAPDRLGLHTATRPNMALATAFPEIAATSYISTPGATVAANANQLDSSGTTFVHFDTSNDGAQSSFPFGRITLIPDEHGNVSADLTGSLQTRGEYGHRPPLQEVFSFKLGSPSSLPVSFEDALHYRPNETYLRHVTDAQLDPIVAAANDKSRFPDGVTMFVTNSTERLEPYLPMGRGRELTGFMVHDIDVEQFAVVDGDASGDSGWSADDLQSMVTNEGDSLKLQSVSERVFDLSQDDQGLSYGGARIIRSQKVHNGWVHIVDALPQPESLGERLLEGLSCDGDGNGACDADDLAMMYSEAGGDGQFDYDENGTVDFRDIEWWLSLASRSETNPANPHSRTYIEGDLDLDFDVDQDDLDIFSVGAEPSWGNGDLTMNGKVDWRDLDLIRENFGFVSPAPSTVPEPNGNLVWLLATLGVIGRSMRRRRA